MVLELNIKPWCNCIIRGAWNRMDGWSLDLATGLWVHPRCMKPSQMNYHRMIHGKPMLPQRSHIIHDIWEAERLYDLRKWARAEIENELGWDLDDLD